MKQKDGSLKESRKLINFLLHRSIGREWEQERERERERLVTSIGNERCTFTTNPPEMERIIS